MKTKTTKEPSPLSRRAFLGGAALAATTATGLAAKGGEKEQKDRYRPLGRSGIRITRVKLAHLEAPRWKMVGRNSQLGLHGDKAGDVLMVIETDAGITGFGQTWSRSRRHGEALLGRDPLDFYRPGVGVVSPLGHYDWPLWDLVARILEVPLWQLFGGYGASRVPVYDGSIYFTDIEKQALRPERLGVGIARVLKEVEYSLNRGHRAFKIKIGRGRRWYKPMSKGLKQDLAVVKAIRRLVGPKVRLMVDANNAFTPEITRQFLEEADQEFHFIEEMFPENIEQDLALKGWLKDRGLATMVADGESASTIDHFVPYIQARALDCLQGDARAFGFTRLVQLSRMTAQTGIKIVPHNWGSCLGNYMQAILGRGIPNFGYGEEDPGVIPFIKAPGFTIEDGLMSVPDTVGSGLVWDEKGFIAAKGYAWTVEEKKR